MGNGGAWDFLPEEQRKQLAEIHKVVDRVCAGPFDSSPKLVLAVYLVSVLGVLTVLGCLVCLFAK